eukprot:366540-Chlamydomonas_euryale.AAC.13
MSEKGGEPFGSTGARAWQPRRQEVPDSQRCGWLAPAQRAQLLNAAQCARSLPRQARAGAPRLALTKRRQLPGVAAQPAARRQRLCPADQQARDRQRAVMARPHVRPHAGGAGHAAAAAGAAAAARQHREQLLL